VTLSLRPSRGGFLRPFRFGPFVRDFLLGKGPHGSVKIDPEIGAHQAFICMWSAKVGQFGGDGLKLSQTPF